MGRIALLCLTIFSITAQAATLAEVTQGLEDYYRLSSDLSAAPAPGNASPVNAVRMTYISTLAHNWAEQAAKLDPESHNILVLALVERYSQQISTRPATSLLLSELDSSVKPELIQQQELDNGLLALDYGAEYSLYYLVTLRTALAAWNHMGRPAPWNALLKARAEALARRQPPPAGLLTYRPQPLPEVAGLLEYKRSSWERFVLSAKNGARSLRPGPIAVQVFASTALGFTSAFLEQEYKRGREQKFSPVRMLNLHQINLACEMANVVVEIKRACTQESSCSDPQAKRAKLEAIFDESIMLQEDYKSLEHLYTDQPAESLKRIVGRVPIEKRPLFNELIRVNSAVERQERCQEVALGLTASEAKETQDMIDDYFGAPAKK